MVCIASGIRKLVAAVTHIPGGDSAIYKTPEEAKKEHEHIEQNEAKYLEKIKALFPESAKVGDLEYTPIKADSNKFYITFEVVIPQGIHPTYLAKLSKANGSIFSDSPDNKIRAVIIMDRLE